VSANPLLELRKLRQSVWFDNISRGMILSGRLQGMIKEDGLSGVTSNPSIFHKAITGSDDYRDDLKRARTQGLADPEEIFYALAYRDIQMAADCFLGVYENTQGVDGYVSIEVSPHLAHDTERTLSQARRIITAIGRRNVLVKVPATSEGIPAIEKLISEGINVNVTLLFAIERYEQAADAYITGLEARARQGAPLDSVASVASFFVSRVDTMVDGLLEDRIKEAQAGSEAEELKKLLGKAGVANAKLAYRKYREILSGPRFSRLKDKGARPQRVLWASTSTKNPAYNDLLYVEELIGSDTVTTLPPATYDALKDHGKVQPTVESDIKGAEQVVGKLADAGINLQEVTSHLEADGVRRFAESHDAILSSLAGEKPGG